MRGVNKVIIVGNLGADPDVKQFQNGGSVTTISVATSEKWNDKQTGEPREQTEWHRISLHNKLGEIAAQYLRKGSSVYIEGSLRTRKYQDQNGQDRFITEIRADQMQMLGGNPANQGGYNNYNGGGNAQGGYNNPYNGNGGNGYPAQGYQNNQQNFGNQSQSVYPNHQPAQGGNTYNHQPNIGGNPFMDGQNQPQIANQNVNQMPSPAATNPQVTTPKAGTVDDDIPF